MGRRTSSIILSLLLLASPVWAQSTVIRGANKGSSTANPVTSTIVDANHNALDVNLAAGSISITGADGAIVDGVSAAIRATIFDLTNSNPLATQIVDANGDPITSFGGGTQYNQGTVSTSTDTLTMMGCVRADTAAVASGVIDGDRARCIIDSTGRIWTFAAQSGTWNVGTVTTLTSITNPVTVTDGAGALNVIVDSLPTVTVTDGAGALNVIVDSGTTTVTQGTGTNLHTVVDSGTISTITNAVTVTDGAGALNVIVDSLPTVTVTDGAGALNVIVDSGTTTVTQATGTNLHTVIDSGTTTVTQATGTNLHTVVDSGVITSITNSVTVTDGSGAMNVIVDSGTLTAVTAITNALPTGTNTIGAFTGTSADNSANATLKLPVLPSLANAAAPSWTEGRQVPLSVDLAGNLRVNSTGGGVTDNSAFTIGTTTQSPIGGVYKDSAAVLTDGVTAAVRMTEYRGLYTTPLDGNGIESGTRLNPLAVNLSGVSGISTASLLNDTTQIQVTSVDPFGRLLSTATISDGSGRYAALRGPEGAQINDAGLVVQHAVAPSLQCPYVVGVNQTTSTVLVTNKGGQAIHVCAFQAVSATAQNVSLVEGTGSVCATGTAGLWGGTSASVALAANGGGGPVSDRIVAPMQKSGDNICLLQSGAGNVSGTLTYGTY